MLERSVKTGGSSPAVEETPSADVEYHLRRARAERAVADRAANAFAADAHMRLSELHLERAQMLEAVKCRSLGNVHPFEPRLKEARRNGR